MKLPRDLNAKELIKALNKIGYQETRQVCSHIRLSITRDGNQFHITIPNHNPIKIGTLNNILK
jgi:predicted RNA binding protein YcfA (HicA-like mRNA interferase family)